MPTPVSKTVVLMLIAGLALPLHAQPPATPPVTESAPTPAPASQPGEQPAAAPAVNPAQPADPAVPHTATPAQIGTDPLGRRISANTTDTVLAFPEATVKQIIPFIVESTGKVVMPTQSVLQIRITIVNDKPIPRGQALDLVFFALQQAGVAVIEQKDFIILRDQTKLNQGDPIPVMPASESTLGRTDLGSYFQKVFLLRHGSATNVAEIVKPLLTDQTAISSDNDSGQVIVTASIAMLQRIERVINELDRPPADMPKSETFHLTYANAEDIATQINALYADTTNNPNRARNNAGGGGGGGGGGARFQPGGGGGGNQPRPGGAAGGGEAGSGARAQATPASSILRVSANKVQNSVTVVAEGNILELIRRDIAEQWDKPIPKTIFTQRVYDMKYQDPIQIRIALEGLFGTGTTAPGGQARTTQGPLANQFTFQALRESQRLIVVGKTEDNFAIIDELIEKLDQPMLAGLPEIIELKHVQAEDLAEQLNALLAQEGTLATIRRVNTELSAGNSSSASPFSQEFSSSPEGGFTQTTSNADNIQFWWQRARPATDNFGTSNLVGKARIMPIAKQNSLLVLAPLEYKASLTKLIDMLDKPGRQVLISAVIAEVTGDDDISVGIRWGAQPITPTNNDNSFSIGPRADNANTITGIQNDFLPGLFDTSVLDVGANINVLLQALAQDTKVNILSEPKIFTGDNQEATFFDGQDIPFITDSQPNSLGNVVNSFDYRAVGINLRIRPRITPERDVDLKVNLELSSIQPQQTLFGGFIVDRRETTTQLIIKDGQTVIMSGILRSEDSDIKRKVPLLGDIPLVGELFKSTERSKSSTELLAFITPLVVNSQADSDRLNDGPRKRLDQLRKALQLEQTPAGNIPVRDPENAPVLDMGPPPQTDPANNPKPMK